MFLFELCLVLTRSVEDKEGCVVFQVYRQPLPTATLHLEDLPDGEGGGGGAFRGAFTSGNDKGVDGVFLQRLFLNSILHKTGLSHDDDDDDDFPLSVRLCSRCLPSGVCVCVSVSS